MERMAVLYLGALPHDEELILVALVVGMAASGTILLSAIPAAAYQLHVGNLDPERGEVPCSSSTRRATCSSACWPSATGGSWPRSSPRSRARSASASRPMLRSRRAKLGCRRRSRPVRWWPSHGTLTTGLSQRSENASQILGFEPQASYPWAAQRLPRTRASGGPQYFRRPNQGALPREPIVFGFLSLYSSRWARSVARGDRQGGVRRDRPLFASQGIDP